MKKYESMFVINTKKWEWEPAEESGSKGRRFLYQPVPVGENWISDYLPQDPVLEVWDKAHFLLKLMISQRSEYIRRNSIGSLHKSTPSLPKFNSCQELHSRSIVFYLFQRWARAFSEDWLGWCVMHVMPESCGQLCGPYHQIWYDVCLCNISGNGNGRRDGLEQGRPTTALKAVVSTLLSSLRELYEGTWLLRIRYTQLIPFLFL